MNTRLEFPDGAPVRYLAWPLLLCSLLFENSVHAVAAFHLGILTWLSLQGVLMMYLFQDFLEDRLCAFVAATLALCAPQVLIALGNAQFENEAPAFLLLIGWSIERKRYKRLLFGLLELFRQSIHGIPRIAAGIDHRVSFEARMDLHDHIWSIILGILFCCHWWRST